MIKVGFTDDADLWRSGPLGTDVRPYGNFVVNRDKSELVVFTMRDAQNKSRYFKFPLPKLSDGVFDSSLNLKAVTLSKEDIIDSFDCNYHRYMQGAAINKGILYSLEGFTANEVNIPAIRIVDLNRGIETEYIDLFSMGYPVEPEFIDFYNDRCIYIDAEGNSFTLEF